MEINCLVKSKKKKRKILFFMNTTTHVKILYTEVKKRYELRRI